MPKAKTNLVIVESPSKAKTIGKYLGSEYQVKACMGHLRDLPKSTMGVDLENSFDPVYQPVKGKEDIISDLKKSAKNSDQIFLATDPDREGEAISWHLQALLGIPDEKVNRVTINEITRGVVTKAIQQPLIRIWWMPSRPAVFWIGSWAISCLPFFGKKSAVAFLPVVSSLWPPVWWWTGKMRFEPLSRRNTGPSM